jgi:histidyl-tRNA synthetase
MKNQIPSVKGARDFYPEQMRVRSWLYRMMRKVSESFGYEEYDGPFLEYLELYAAKSGDELVKEQSFVFKDRGGEWITLRPELTPSLARMVAQKQNQLVYPLRWWSFGPMWRYERPQKGRSREFFQWNIDMVGLALPEADAELIAVGAGFFHEAGLKPDEVQILVNNRRLIETGLDRLEIPAAGRADILRLIDRIDKLPLNKWEEYAATDFGLTAQQIVGLLTLVQDKDAWRESDELVSLFDTLEALGVSEYVTYAPEIVRGLDYYTGTVFEGRDRDGEFRAIFGGGRYDNLVADVGGEPLPGVGFAMGDAVITLVLEKYGKIPSPGDLAPQPVLITVFDESMLLDTISLSRELRSEGINCATHIEPVKLVKQLKYADRIGASVAVLLGPDEIAQNTVTIKDLIHRDQQTVPRSMVIPVLREILASHRAS